MVSDEKFNTEVIHSMPDIDYGIKSLNVPIYQTSTYYFSNVDEAAGTFNGDIPGFCYSRGGNPTVKYLEAKLASLEHGEEAIITGSGMGAVSSVLLSKLNAGDHIVSGECLYGCSTKVIKNELPRFNIEYSLVDTTDLEAVKSAIRPNTKIIYLETPTNPTIKLTDIKKVCELAHEKEILVVVDNTFAPPPVQYPIDLGADIVVHSLTKYINGHGDVIAGAIIGRSEDLAHIRGGVVTKLTGSIISPNDAFLVIRGMKTLGLRMKKHCENALEVAEFLNNHKYVKSVAYPGLKDNPDYELAKTQMNNLFGGMVSFELEDNINGLTSYEACKKLLNELRIVKIAVSLGDCETLIQHPASMTHNLLGEDELKEAKISKNQLRLSLGIEDSEDIIKDFENAFSKL